jgi:hypothetical protein
MVHTFIQVREGGAQRLHNRVVQCQAAMSCHTPPTISRL